MTTHPLGSFPHASGTRFTLWALGKSSASVEIDGNSHTMTDLGEGYFSADVPGVGSGARYRFRLDGAEPIPDLASRWQPDGNDGASAVVSDDFAWTDAEWPGVAHQDQVLYELHVGTFTPEGTWAAAKEKLNALRDLGITTIQIMPVAAFKGRFGWGYDTTFPYAPFAPYGTPDDMRAFVDRAHALGVGVILDVVYNHAGLGDYYVAYSPHFHTKSYENEWGESFNFDGEGSAAVRAFFIDNARYWIEAFHLDGLRIDAVQALFDNSEEHILTAITRTVREAGGSRQIYMVVENQPQERRMVEPPERGGCGVDAMYNDDFHHSVLVAATGHNDFYYQDYWGTAQEIASALKYGFLYQGQRSPMRNQPYGTYNLETPPEHFLHFLENHDQVANSARGYRLAHQTSRAELRAITPLLLLGPQTPCLFQGQEFASSKPFLYFAGAEGDMANAVNEGRSKGLQQFSSVRDPAMLERLASATDAATFKSCKLDWSECDSHADILALHRDLLALRRDDAPFSHRSERRIDTAVLADAALFLRIITPDAAGHRLLLVNLGRDLPMASLAQPLLAPPDAHQWSLTWSSEHPKYGGSGRYPFDPGTAWTLSGKTALVLSATPQS